MPTDFTGSWKPLRRPPRQALVKHWIEVDFTMTEMKRWELSAYGRENFSLASGPRPSPKSGEALVEVEAVSLNHRDHLITRDGLGTGRFPWFRAATWPGVSSNLAPTSPGLKSVIG